MGCTNFFFETDTAGVLAPEPLSVGTHDSTMFLIARVVSPTPKLWRRGAQPSERTTTTVPKAAAKADFSPGGVKISSTTDITT